MKNLLKHAFILCTGLVILGARADTLFVSGTVLDTSGALVPGAVVTAHAGGFGGGRGSFGGGGTGYTGGAGLRATDTADANGNYSIVIPNDTFSTVTISATATGFRTSGRGQIDTIAAPKDGKSDYATVNVILTEGTYTVAATGDSLIVSGTVTDSAGNPVDSATVTVRTGRTGAGGLGGGFGGRGVLTGTNGKYTVNLRGDSTGLVTVTASTRGGKTGSTPAVVAHPKDGVLDQITVNVQLGTIGGGTPGDSVYISGTVVDSMGNPVDSAIVSVRVGNGYAFEGGMATVMTGASGTYFFAIVGDTSGIVTVSATRLRLNGNATQKVTAPNDGTADHLTGVVIIVGSRFFSAVLQPRLAPRARGLNLTNAPYKIYSLDGRCIGFNRTGAVGNNAVGPMGRQMVIYRYQTDNEDAAVKSIQLK